MKPLKPPTLSEKERYRRRLTVWVGLVRWKNLLLVGATQYLMRFALLCPLLAIVPADPVLDGLHFFLLVLDTILITAGGYLINDRFDTLADTLNRPETVRIGALVTARQVMSAYWITTLGGGIIAVYLALVAGHPGWFLLYPGAVILLWYYSYRLKYLPLAGNLLVAVYCSLAAAVVFLPDHEAWSGAVVGGAFHFRTTLVVYLWYSFHITLIREIIKDAEDLDGDRAVGARTFPVLFGLDRTNTLAAGLTYALCVFVLVFAVREWHIGHPVSAVSWAFGMGLPLAWFGKNIRKASGKTHYSRLSKTCKWLMLIGLFLLVLWKY
ncbi:MAG: hypothetical protein RLY31_1553 [Bacteroidota bacterium]|jgi:4-hydroxybenzoate polyprenyltransferase